MTELPKRANLPIRVYTPPSVEEHDAGHDEVLEASVSDVTADALYRLAIQLGCLNAANQKIRGLACSGDVCQNTQVSIL